MPATIITTEAPMKGAAGVVGKTLHLSQGVTRTLASRNEPAFTEISVIDFSAMNGASNSAEAKSRLVSDVFNACTRSGFFVIKNHGVDWKIVENAFESLEEFFSLPMEKKMAAHQSNSISFQGYEQFYYTNVDRLKKGDLKESITTAYDPHHELDGVGDAMPELLIRRNQWPNPKDAPKFRPAMEAYRTACLKLIKQLMRILARAMGEKEDFFEKKTTYPSAGIRGIHYPPQAGTDEDETGFGAHTDVQMVTLIAQKPYHSTSLAVLNTDGEWISPKLEPQTFLVNLGDMMDRLTNGVFLSTVHRVCNKGDQERYSLPLFFGINNDELVNTLPQFITRETPLREVYEKGVTSYEHFNNRLRNAHHNHPSAAGETSTALLPGMTKVDGVLVEGL